MHNEQERESFVFYSSFYHAIELFPDETRLRLFRTICEFAIKNNDISEELNNTEKAIFELIKPQLLASNNRYDKAKRNGKLGGRPKNNLSEVELTSEEQEILEIYAKRNDAKNTKAYIATLVKTGDYKQILEDEIQKSEKLAEQKAVQEQIKNEEAQAEKEENERIKQEIASISNKEGAIEYIRSKVKNSKFITPIYNDLIDKFKLTKSDIDGSNYHFPGGCSKIK